MCWGGEPLSKTVRYTMLYNTGARVSEIIGVHVSDVAMDESTCVHLRGKGRKQRTTPLWKSTVKEIRGWLRRNPMLEADSALLPNRKGQAMSRFNVTQRLDIAVVRATKMHSSLTKRKISPHTVRHYVPFLIMSCKVKYPAEMIGNCWSHHAKSIRIQDIIFPARDC
jgi:site-specific recombinase XerD